MRTSAVVVVAALYAGLTIAQDLGAINNLPDCGKRCINDMLSKAGELGCGNSDIACLCKNANFGYGIRDCTNVACTNEADRAPVFALGNSICAGYTASGVQTVTATQTAGTTTLVISTGTNTAGQALTTTLGTVGGVPPTGVAVLFTTTDASGSMTVITNTVAASATESGASVITTTNSAGMTTVYTAGASNSTGAAGGGVVVLTGTNSLGSTVLATTTLSGSMATGTIITTTNASGMAITTSQAASTTRAAATTTTSAGGAAHLAGPALGGVAGLLAMALL